MEGAAVPVCRVDGRLGTRGSVAVRVREWSASSREEEDSKVLWRRNAKGPSWSLSLGPPRSAGCPAGCPGGRPLDDITPAHALQPLVGRGPWRLRQDRKATVFVLLTPSLLDYGLGVAVAHGVALPLAQQPLLDSRTPLPSPSRGVVASRCRQSWIIPHPLLLSEPCLHF